MRLVQIMVGALVVAAGSAQASRPSQDTMGQLEQADGQLQRSDVKGAQRTLERLTVSLTTGATVSGREARVAVNGVLAALGVTSASGSRAHLAEAITTLKPGGEQGKSQGYQMGWRMGYADARAGHYTGHRPSHGDLSRDQLYQGYEDGWSAGNSSGF